MKDNIMSSKTIEVNTNTLDMAVYQDRQRGRVERITDILVKYLYGLGVTKEEINEMALGIYEHGSGVLDGYKVPTGVVRLTPRD